MPMYAFRCEECYYGDDLSRTLAKRDEPQDCPECGGLGTMKRLFSKPYITAIGGIPNKFNRHWNEGDRHTKVMPLDGRRDERREFIKRARETKRKRREKNDAE